MTVDDKQVVRIGKALRAAEVLVTNLRDAHAKTENVAEEMVLVDLLGDAARIRDRLGRLAGAIAAEG